MEINMLARNYLQKAIKHRRIIHKNPELSFVEYDTSEYIREQLRTLGIKFELVGETGVVGKIGKGTDCIALRADIDALPVKEETGLEFASVNDGIMHGCGHDMHTAMLLTSAEILKKLENEFDGTILFIFQPGEEKLPGGANLIIESGALNSPVPQLIVGQHVNPEYETGTVAFAPGAIMAAADELYWNIRGICTHAAQPHLGSDTIVAASNLIVHLQSLVSRHRNPLEPGLLSITAINGGNTTNILPDEVRLKGTLRTYNEIWRAEARRRIRQSSVEICRLYDTECTVDIVEGYPPLINDPKATGFIRSIAEDIFNKENILDFIPKMWAEDFAYYTQKYPSVFWFLGVKSSLHNEFYPLHNGKFSPDEEAMVWGIAMFVGACMKFFKKNQLIV